jgi:hypothetical protein
MPVLAKYHLTLVTLDLTHYDLPTILLAAIAAEAI